MCGHFCIVPVFSSFPLRWYNVQAQYLLQKNILCCSNLMILFTMGGLREDYNIDEEYESEDDKDGHI